MKRPSFHRSAALALLLLAGGTAVAFAAPSAWLTLCPDKAPARPVYQTEYFDPSGARRVLAVGSERGTDPACVRLDLAVPPDQVVWAALLPPALAQSLAKGVILQGADTPSGFRPGEIIPAAPPPARAETAPLAAGVELLPQFQARPFGREERVTVTPSSGRLTVVGRTGSAPAGVLLRAPGRSLPEGAELRLRIAFTGSGEFGVGVADTTPALQDSPLPLGRLHATGESQSVELAVPRAGLDRVRWSTFSLSAPAGASRLEITSLKLETARGAGAAPGRRAIWAWQPGLWVDTPEQLLERLERSGSRVVFITVPVKDPEGVVRAPDELARFIRLASKQRVAVWAVAGDPRAVLTGERGRFVRIAQAYAKYNERAQPDARLAGAQYDIEPYLVSGYSLDPDRWNAAYVNTIAALKQAGRMPLEVVVPFWFADRTAGGHPLLDALTPHVDSVNVMDYRTDPAEIRRLAQPFLAWGARTRKKVRIALEAGPIDDEARRHYQPAEKGELWLTRLGTQPVLVLLKQPLPNPNGQAFRYARSSTFSGSTLTFRGREQALLDLLPSLEEHFAAWPSFAGLALHELK